MAFVEILECSKNEAVVQLISRRGRAFSSDYEAWANLKELAELVKAEADDIGKLHKSMWAEVKDKDADAFTVLLLELGQKAMLCAAECVQIGALSEIAAFPPSLPKEDEEANGDG